MKIKTGIIGLGRIGSHWDNGILCAHPRSHVGAILQNENFKLSAACDSSNANRTRFENEWKLNIPTYSSVEEMLEREQLEVITVAVPAPVHYPVLKAAVKSRPRIIFCEKPFCASVSEAGEICDSAEKEGIILLVNYHRRWDENIRALKKKLDAMPSIPEHVSVFYRKGLLNYGSHLVNLLMFFFGPVVSVKSMPVSGEPDLDDPSVSSTFHFQSGLEISMIGIDSVKYELFDIDIYYSECRFRLEFGGYVIEEQKVVKDLYFKDYVNLKSCEERSFRGEILGLPGAYREISDCIVTGRPCITNTAFSAVQTLKVLDAIRESARNGKIIPI